MKTANIYAIHWNDNLQNIEWTDWKKIEFSDAMCFFLNTDLLAIIAVRHAIDKINEQGDFYNAKDAFDLCTRVFPYMKQSKKSQIKHLDKQRTI